MSKVRKFLRWFIISYLRNLRNLVLGYALAFLTMFSYGSYLNWRNSRRVIIPGREPSVSIYRVHPVDDLHSEY